MAKTLQADMAELIQLFGWIKASSGRKRSIWQHPNHPNKIFLGNSGAIRVGRLRSDSISWTDRRESFIYLLINGKIGG